MVPRPQSDAKLLIHSSTSQLTARSCGSVEGVGRLAAMWACKDSKINGRSNFNVGVEVHRLGRSISDPAILPCQLLQLSLFLQHCGVIRQKDLWSSCTAAIPAQ